MKGLPIGQMPAEEFETLMDDFIGRRSGEDDRLPGDVFFELLGQAEQEFVTHEAPIQVTGQVLGGQLVLTAPPGSPLRVEGNRIRWADGREMVIELAR
jgi:hypothetical protein